MDRKGDIMAQKQYRPFIPLLLISICLVFLGINGVVGGYLMLADPNGTPMGLLISDLTYTPFQNFFIPGLLLLLVWGCGSFVTLIGLWLPLRQGSDSRAQGLANEHWAWLFCFAMGVGLVVWLFVQLLTIPNVAPIQYMLLGLAVLLIGLPLTQSM